MKKKTTDSTLRKRLPLGRRSTIQLLRQPDLPDDPSLPASRYARSTALAGRMIAGGQFDIRLLTVLAECMEAFEALPDGMKARLAGLRSAQEELAGELEASLWLLQLESSLGGPIRSEEQKLKAMLSCIALTEIVRRGVVSGKKAVLIRSGVLAAKRQLDG